jgi:hypothetical protein
MIGLALALLQAAGELRVAASVDRNRVQVGDEVVYSLRATAAAPGNFRIELPQASGIEVLDRSERTDLVVGSSPPAREFAVEIRLRATQVGTWQFSPVLVFVGSRSELAPDVSVTVTGAGPADPSASNPILLGLIQRAPPPTSGSTATLGIVVSSNLVHQGDQLDVLTTAWFPRSLRSRLRRPPTLKPPVLAGVWSVPQPAVPGIVTSRAIGDEVYDLFVSHQVVFPLTPGRLTIPPARLEYGVPSGRRTGGDERPVEAASQPVDLSVLPLPDGGRPAGFSGPVGRNFRIGYRLRTLPARVGEPLPVEIALSGDGNLAFWSPPNVLWPAGSRAYLDHVSDAPRSAGGRLGGVKTFHFLLVADSVGSLPLPSLSFPYFDPVRGYLEAASPGMVVPVLEPSDKGPKRPSPPLVPVVADWPWVIAAPSRLPVPWWTLALGPILVAGLIRIAARRRPRARRAAVARPAPLEVLDRMIVALVPEEERGRADGIVHGFRQAGLDRETALELARLKVEVDRARFAAGSGADAPSLGTRIEAELARLPGGLRRALGIAAVFIAAIAVPRLTGQERSPEELYRAGQAHVAAEAFAGRAAADSTRWQNWYDLGAARYLAGEDAAAAAALERAFLLAPRARVARALWTELEREHEPLHEVSRAGGLALSEWRVLLIALGLVAAFAVGLGRGSLLLRGGLVALVLAGVVAISRAEARDRDPAGFTRSSLTLRLSPHGLAPELGALPALSRVVVEGSAGDWVLVRDARGTRGWLLRSAVVPIRRLN